MRAIKLAVVVGLAAASAALATDGKAVFSINGSNTNPLNAIVLGVDPYLSIVTSVVVTGNNQGLGGFNFDVGIYPVANPTSGNEVPLPLFVTAGVDWAAVYKAPGSGSVGTVKDNGGAGGPGMDVLPQLGNPAATVAYTAQIGAAHLDWKARVYATYTGGGTRKKWQGDDTWGVGLDSRKSVLLQDGQETYDLWTAVVDLTGVPLGNYLVKLTPNGASVLQAGLDLNQDQIGSTTYKLGAGDLTGGSFEFSIVPEPATLLLIAGAGLLVRRRRA